MFCESDNRDSKSWFEEERQKSPHRTAHGPDPLGWSNSSQACERHNPNVIGPKAICIQKTRLGYNKWRKIHMLVNLMHMWTFESSALVTSDPLFTALGSRVLPGLEPRQQRRALSNRVLHTWCQPQFMSLTTILLVKPR